VVAFEGIEESVGLVKSQAILAGYFLERGFMQELELLEASLRKVPPPVAKQAKQDVLSVQDRVFWEMNDHGINFDFIEPGRRTRVIQVLDRLTGVED
jgi:hypothetical protein